MARAASPSFICELPLILVGDAQHVLLMRLDVARQAYNALLRESLRRLALLRQSKAYQSVRTLPKGQARTQAFADLNARFGFREYDLHRWATTHISQQWLGKHLDSNTIQKLATRAFQACQQYAFGLRGRPRYKGRRQFDSLEGKSNRAGIRWTGTHVTWNKLDLVARIDPADPVIAHALACPVKYVRIVRRKLNGKQRFFVQLICQGQPYRKPQHGSGQDTIGIDPGPRTFGIAGADWGAQIDLAAPLKRSRREQRQLQRQIDRQRRANNPGNYLSDGRVRPGRTHWRISQNQRDNERRLAEAQRTEAAHRKSLHGQLANTILALGNDIRIEQNSYRSFQKTYGKAVGQAAPATFVRMLTRKAARADASVQMLPTSLRLSQTCVCGRIARKQLSERVHHCECGITVQRDVWSSYLARFCVAVEGPAGPSWQLDAEAANLAVSGAGSRLPAASSSSSVGVFATWARAQSASGCPFGDASLPSASGGSERIVGAAGAMVREGSDGVAHDVLPGHDARELSRAHRVASRTPEL
jgi:putative transposase